MRRISLWLALGAAIWSGCWNAGSIGSDEPDSGTTGDTGSDVDTGDDSDTDTGVGTDVDTGSGSDPDTDTDTGPAAPCGGEPEECTDIGPTLAIQENGCCHGNTLYWCIECVEDEDNGGELCIAGQKWLKSFDCGDVGGVCGIEGEDDTYVTCEDVDEEPGPWGCDGFVKFCEDIGDFLSEAQFGCCLAGFRFDCWDAGYVYYEDCIGAGFACGYDQPSQQIDCVDE